MIGYTCGAYDLLHIGHINLLRNAKALCDKLIVGVSDDELIIVYKKKTPTIPFIHRIEIVRSLKFVDAAIPQRNLDKVRAYEKLKYDILFVSDDWHNDNSWIKYGKVLKEKGVKIVYLPHTPGISTTEIAEGLKC